MVGGIALTLKGTGYLTALKALGISLAVVAVVNLHPLGKSVNYRRAYAVQTAGEFISVAAEFSSRVENGVYHLKGRNSHFGVNSGGNTASVVANGNGIVLVDSHDNLLTVTCKCLVDRVVDDLVHQMMQTARRGRSYIHSGAFSYRFKTFKDLYLAFVVCVLVSCHFFFPFGFCVGNLCEYIFLKVFLGFGAFLKSSDSPRAI